MAEWRGAGERCCKTQRSDRHAYATGVAVQVSNAIAQPQTIPMVHDTVMATDERCFAQRMRSTSDDAGLEGPSSDMLIARRERAAA